MARRSFSGVIQGAYRTGLSKPVQPGGIAGNRANIERGNAFRAATGQGRGGGGGANY